MKVLVTGGLGFIGKHLVKFLSKNNQVLVYDNSDLRDVEVFSEKGIEFLQGDILDYDVLCEFSKGVDIIIHLAAKTDVASSVINPEITNKVNVDGTSNVLKCCMQNKIKKIIFTSSAAVYGDSKTIPIREDSETHPKSPYGQSKLDAEKVIVKTCNDNDINYTILRMFNVYGKGQNDQYAGVITKFFRNIREGKPIIIFGDGKQTRDFVSINDVMQAFDCAIKSETSGIYNIAGGKSLSVNELIKIISEVCEKKLNTIYKEIQQGDIQHSVADVSLARTELGFSAKRSLNDELSSIYHE